MEGLSKNIQVTLLFDTPSLYIYVIRSLFFQQLINVCRVIQRVINEELQLRNDAQLMANTVSQLKAYSFHVVIDVLHDLFASFRRENAEINTSVAHVGADADNAD